ERIVAAFPGFTLLYDLDRRGQALLARETDRWSLMGRAPAEAHERDLSWHDQSEGVDLSRDGSLVLFNERGARGDENGSIYLRRTDGAPAVRLGEGVPLALSPDGAFVLARHQQRDDALVVLPTGPGERRVLEHSGLVGYWDAAFGPDGRSFAFVGGSA